MLARGADARAEICSVEATIAVLAGGVDRGPETCSVEATIAALAVPTRLAAAAASMTARLAHRVADKGIPHPMAARRINGVISRFRTCPPLPAALYAHSLHQDGSPAGIATIFARTDAIGCKIAWQRCQRLAEGHPMKKWTGRIWHSV